MFLITSMAIENTEIKIASQLNDVMVLIAKLVEVIKNKGDYTSLIADLMVAINGVEEIPAEFKADMFACIDTVLLSATQIARIFVAKEEV